MIEKILWDNECEEEVCFTETVVEKALVKQPDPGPPYLELFLERDEKGYQRIMCLHGFSGRVKKGQRINLYIPNLSSDPVAFRLLDADGKPELDVLLDSAGERYGFVDKGD